MQQPPPDPNSSLRDNRPGRGTVDDFLTPSPISPSPPPTPPPATLAGAHPAALEKLCDLFDARSKNGTDLTHENHLLDHAIASIKSTFGKHAAATLFSSREGKLPTTAETPTSGADLELITWLIITETPS